MTAGSADHRRILESASAWSGAPMALATVVETWKSAPCPVGTHMLVHQDGRFTGSVSGGCVEGDVLEIAARVIAEDAFALRRYGVADGAAWEVGLPCGGGIVGLVQNVSPTHFPERLFAAIAGAQAAGKILLIGSDLKTGASAVVDSEDGQEFVNRYLPPRRLIIVGAVEIAASLCAIARSMGVEVIVVDPRARFLTGERFPETVLDDRWPDEAIAALRPDARTAVVTLSHDPKIDDPALAAALETPAAYVAALGSKTSHARRLERLAATGIRADRLARIEGPAGIAINAISAPEIALSIAGGMVRAFNNGMR
ncbi:MAG: XdhC family protein [Sphingomonadaceae bacterium]|nr:XdhC family protein [Sphingomonadaceae bacterium]